MTSWVERIVAGRVGDSPDLRRVLALPRRPPPGIEVVGEVTRRLARPRRDCGCQAMGRRCVLWLTHPQAWGLDEAGRVGGLLAPIVAGGGKTLLGILVAMVVRDCQKAVMLVPPGLVGQLWREYLAAAEHFTVPSLVMPDGSGRAVDGAPVVTVVPYSKFSRPESSALLEGLRPDLVIADEAHCLKSRRAARTLRVLRYFAAHPETRLCAWSGTITSRSLDDFAHLSALALGEGSPLPLDPDEVLRWAAAVDPSDWPAPPGALATLGEPVRDAVRRRVVDTLGVVATSSGSLPGATLVMRERPARLPARLRAMARNVRATMVRPDGEELLTALQVAACVRQLVCGFYYRWRFPGRPDPALVDEWFEARRAWGREMRAKLARPAEHMDSPRLLANAAERHERGAGLPSWASQCWARWRDVKDLVAHETEAVWVDDYLARDAAAWAASTRGVVWYEHAAFGAAVARLAGLPQHGGGPGAETAILAERGDRSVVASIRAHGTGRDGLQRLFSKQLVICPPPDGQTWEQLLARLHRVGQDADEVVTHVYRHVEEFRDAIDRALVLAKYIEGMSSNQQRLLAANVEW